MMTDAQLLQNFAGQNSEAAFRALVERHFPLVFGTAKRMTGDAALAEDVAQTVFILLSRKAGDLQRHPVLSGWLYQTARFVTSRALTAEQRRRRREQEAVSMQSLCESDTPWMRVCPELDNALAQLSETDRDAIVLRYLQEQSLRDVGLALGLSEEAAKKRVARALEKLRHKLRRRGLVVSAVALAAGLSQEAAEAATALPLAGKVASAVLAHGAAGAGAASSALLTKVLAARRLIKILNLAASAAAVITALLLIPPAVQRWQAREKSSVTEATAPLAARPSETARLKNLFATKQDKAARQTRPLVITVVDARTGAPVPGAKLSPFANCMGLWPGQTFQTGLDGKAVIDIPTNAPNGARSDYFQISVDASPYVIRVMRWYSSTGMVLNTVDSQHTVGLSKGVTLSGTVVDDSGAPLAGLRVGVEVNGLADNSGMEHETDYSDYWRPLEGSPVKTDADGRFRLENYPPEVRDLDLNFLGPDGSLHKFQTPEGFYVHAETAPKISLAELKDGSARIVIPRGVTVEGLVVNAAGQPVADAEVNEATEPANLQILSRNRTDAAGRFFLSNRPPHQVILAVTAASNASLSTIINIRPGLNPIRLQLPAPLPLRGQVVDEAGLPIANARVDCLDYLNHGLGLTWSDETGADGRFEWADAPTNEVEMLVQANGYATRLVRCHASTNESSVTLRLGNNEQMRASIHVTDAESGAPLERFEVQVSQRSIGEVPFGPFKIFAGTNGMASIRLFHKDFPVGMMEGWIMAIGADGYDTTISRTYAMEEGDQQLDFKLTRGGSVEGAVRTPDGVPAAGAQLAFRCGHPIMSVQPGRLQEWEATNDADENGLFKLAKPMGASNLIVFHESGWAIVPITPGAQKASITLSPWARLEGIVTIGQQPAAGRKIVVEFPRVNFQDPMMCVYNATTGGDGRFVIDKLPAGFFKISCRAGRWDRGTMQTGIALAAGETKSVELAANGRAVAVQLQAPPGFAGLNWSNVEVTLKTDAPIPTEPGQSDFIDPMAARRARWNYDHDPAVLAALAGQKVFAGSVDGDGLAVFQNIPAGTYTLEAKLFDTSAPPPVPNFNNDPGPVAARAESAVTVPEGTTEDASPLALGSYALKAP